MLLSKTPNLSNIIIELLARKPNISAQTIWLAVTKQGKNCTLRAVYKELTRLESQEIILRFNKMYALRLSWLVEMLIFVEQTYRSYNTTDHLASIIPMNNNFTISHFSSLRRLDLFWMQVMIALQKLHKRPPMFLWIPYQWFQLVHDIPLKQFFNTEELVGSKRYHVIAKDNYLSRAGAKLIPKGAKVVFDESLFKGRNNIYYTLIGEHLITVKLPARATAAIDRLFTQIDSADKENQVIIDKVLKRHMSITVKIEHNTPMVSKVKRAFFDYFKLK